LERHRALWPYLSELIDAGDRVLHFAPEPVIARNLSALSVDYVPADLDPQAAHLARIVVQAADITRQPWADNHFDIAIVSHVLEHIDDDAAALRELYRVLKPGGTAVIQVPNDPTRDVTYENPTIVSEADRRLHFGQSDHVRVYGRDLTLRVQEAGFRLEVLRPLDDPGSWIFQATKPSSLSPAVP
jgi:SAM-dependent methyltransferase